MRQSVGLDATREVGLLSDEPQPQRIRLRDRRKPCLTNGYVSVDRDGFDRERGITAHISRGTAVLDGLHFATERTIALLKERRAALIAAAVTGQIEVEKVIA